ncbi:MAG: HEAT repeat domain-containing protein [Phycisphaerales bacterium]
MGKELLARAMNPIEFAKLVETGDVERFDATARRALKIREVEEVGGEILKLYESGKLARARDPEEIKRNIEALTGTLRGKLLAKSRLIAAGEYATRDLLNALMDRTNPARGAEVQRVLIEMGRQAIIPLCTAMMSLPHAQQEQIANVLGQIPYRTSLPFLSDLSETTKNEGVKSACERAIARLGGAGGDTSGLYVQLADGYYAEKNELTSFPNEDHQLLWEANPQGGLVFTAIRTQVFHEAMAMRLAERAMQVQAKSGGVAPEVVSLWVASNFSREIDTPEGYVNPAYPVEGAAADGAKARRGADYFGVAAGADVAQMVLARAIDAKDTQLARRALHSVERTVGHSAIIGQSGGRAPLVEALAYPNRRVQFESALALAASQPSAAFGGADRVVPTLASTLRNASRQTAAILATDAETYQGIRSSLESMGYTVFPQGRAVADLDGPIADAGNVDLVVSVITSADRAGGVLEEVRNSPRLAATPVMFLTNQDSYIDLGRRYFTDSSVMVRQIGLPSDTLLRAAYELVQRASGGPISEDEAKAYSSRALTAMRDLALSGNTVLPVSDATSVLIAAAPEASGETKARMVEILCRIDEERAQRAAMDAAMSAEAEEQVTLLDMVAGSAKRFGNKLEARQVTRLVKLAKEGGDAQATAAASLMGALQLPNTDLLPLITGKN